MIPQITSNRWAVLTGLFWLLAGCSVDEVDEPGWRVSADSAEAETSSDTSGFRDGLDGSDAAGDVSSTCNHSQVAATADGGDAQGGMDASPGVSVAAVAAGFDHACAVVEDGGIRCWGDGSVGQLGDGNIGDGYQQSRPVAVEGITSAESIVAAGHTCAVLRNGSARCWGLGTSGQLGLGTTSSGAKPVPVENVESVIDLSAGGRHSCAVLDGGDVYCWGEGDGNPDDSDDSTPAKVEGLGPAVEVASGGDHACAILESGRIRCWGRGYSGELGNGSTDNSSRPVGVEGIRRACAISAGWKFTCAVVANGRVRCWGAGSEGQLGDGNIDSGHEAATPARAGTIDSAVTVDAGYFHVCAVLENGGLRCWGTGWKGRIRSAEREHAYQTATPEPVQGVERAVDVAAGGYFTCILPRGGGVRCFGWGKEGRLGTGESGEDYGEATPVPVQFRE